MLLFILSENTSNVGTFHALSLPPNTDPPNKKWPQVVCRDITGVMVRCRGIVPSHGHKFQITYKWEYQLWNLLEYPAVERDMVLKNRAFSSPKSCLRPLSGGMRRTRCKDRLFFLSFMKLQTSKHIKTKYGSIVENQPEYFQILDHQINICGKPTLKPTILGMVHPIHLLCWLLGHMNFKVAAVWSCLI